MTVLPQRKPHRLEHNIYEQPGAYFITICSHNRQCTFWKAGASIDYPLSTNHLSHIGLAIDKQIAEISKHYADVRVDNYTIMPNHVHLLLTNYLLLNGRAMHAPTTNIITVVQQFKGIVTKQFGFPIWQKSFHDYVIRNEKGYRFIYEYISNNPYRWEADRLNPFF
ncbi:MAG: transposase [Ruminococcus sp.]|nr:transposase [Ruminococcus sp.]